MSKIPDDVVEKAWIAFSEERERALGDHEDMIRAAGDVFVEWALEEAEAKLIAKAEKLWTHNNCYQFSPAILDEAAEEIRALKPKQDAQ
jgi:chaperonin cofactor prefoldin